MRHFIISLFALLAAWTVTAGNVVDCEPGRLAGLVDDCSVTELTVCGRIDARDFRFIADSLRHLTLLDLAGTRVEAFSGTALFANQAAYAAAEIPAQAFAGMSRLATVVFPDSLVRLGDGCLAGCLSLTKVQLPATLVSIGDYAFSACEALAVVELPRSVARIGDGAFSGCLSLVSVSLPPLPSGMGVDVAESSSVSVGHRAFAHCPNLRSVDVGNKLAQLGSEAFIESGLERLDLENQSRLDSIADWALAQTGLRDLRLPRTLRALGDGTLMCDNGVTQLTIPGDVRYLGSYAMAFMTGLEQLTSQAGQVPALGDSVWYGVEQSHVRLNVSPASRADYMSAAQWRDFVFPSALPGDVNGDGAVDVGDINAIVNVMLGKESADMYDGRADVTGDDDIDVGDINAVINIMLERQLALRRAREAARARSAQAGAAASAEGARQDAGMTIVEP